MTTKTNEYIEKLESELNSWQGLYRAAGVEIRAHEKLAEMYRNQATEYLFTLKRLRELAERYYESGPKPLKANLVAQEIVDILQGKITIIKPKS